MAELKLSLRVRLEPLAPKDFFVPEGPLFNRWLPDGRADAVLLSAADSQDRLAVWFERRAKTVNGFLKWDEDATDFDVTIMSRQGVLCAGHLRGEAVLANVDAEQIDAMRELGERNSKEQLPIIPAYEALGKRVVRFVSPALRRFVDTLRAQYGQYWLRQISSWDARKETLGH